MPINKVVIQYKSKVRNTKLKRIRDAINAQIEKTRLDKPKYVPVNKIKSQINPTRKPVMTAFGVLG
jgi:3'-phosphoadenosine 5'-phosphosulfate sulfotransferase